MIKRVTKGKEIAVGVINEIGVLSKIASFLVNHGINLEAIAGSAAPIGSHAALMFVTDNNLDAIDTLVEHGFTDIRENDVLIVELENRPGSLKNITERLAQCGININYVYGTTCIGGCPAKLVIGTSNNDLALEMLSKE